MKKGWTITKLLAAGSLGVLSFILSLSGAGIQAVTGLTGAGGIINTFLTPIMAMICLFVINQFGAATIMFTILGILELPFPLTGTPGFLPKVLILIGAGIIADMVYFFLKTNKKTSSLIIGGVVTVYLAFVIVGAGLLFRFPGAEWMVKMLYSPLVMFSAIAIGIMGGFLGYIIYKRIENTAIVKRIQA